MTKPQPKKRPATFLSGNVIMAVKHAAAEHADVELMALCDRATAGDPEARARIAQLAAEWRLS